MGAGRFGREHLRELVQLEAEGRLVLGAVVVQTEASQQRLANELHVPVHRSLTAELLDTVDAVVIATPAETHVGLVRQALTKCHVLVEKPLSDRAEEAELLVREFAGHGKHLMVGHNYRFHPAIEKVKALVDAEPQAPRLVEFAMLNEVDGESIRSDRNPNLEFLHAFDIMDFLFSQEPTVETARITGRSHEISVRYGDSVHCVMNIGWHSAPRVRRLVVRYSGVTLACDLLRNTVTVQRKNRVDTVNLPPQPVSLRRQFEKFISVIQGEADNPMPPAAAARIIALAQRTTPGIRKRRPRVAVIGGGVFGMNCALELSSGCEVTLIERHAEFMEGVSFVNQWRHHSGFHYPRSYDTIQEIRSAKAAFERHYHDAILRSIPAYFCPAATGIEIPAERYVAACASNYLSFRFEYTPSNIVDRDRIALSLLSDEGVYDFERLRDMTKARLSEAGNVKIELASEVVDGALLADGTKKLTILCGGRAHEEDFDYVVNATYSNINLMAKWFSFPAEPLRFDLYEMLLLRIDIDPICVTVLDGPFTSLLGTGKDNLFLLSHIHDSVLKSDITDDGLPPDWGDIQSNRGNMLQSASSYFPILAEAQVIESRYATRAVNAFARDFDARPTVVRNHGFGCWSVLGGKILTCVSNAREIAAAIASAAGVASAAGSASRPMKS